MVVLDGKEDFWELQRAPYLFTREKYLEEFCPYSEPLHERGFQNGKLVYMWRKFLGSKTHSLDMATTGYC